MADAREEVAACLADLGITEPCTPANESALLSRLAREVSATASAVGIPAPPAPAAGASVAAYAAYLCALGTPPGEAPTAVALLFALSTELQGLRLLAARRRKQEREQGAPSRAAALDAPAAHAAFASPSIGVELYRLCAAVGVPPGSVEALSSAPERALMQVQAKVQRTRAGLPSPLSFGTILDPASLDAGARAALEGLNEELAVDYARRRAMLIARLDVAVQSFLWARKAEGREGEIEATIGPLVAVLRAPPAPIRVETALAAAPGLAVEATGRPLGRAGGASVKGVVIGRVPDRGGRVGDAKGVGASMPAWQARKEAKREAREAGKGGGAVKGGGGGSKEYGAGHEEKAVALLREAAGAEGEAGAALEERLKLDDVEEEEAAVGDKGGAARGGGKGSCGGGGGGGGSGPKAQTWNPRAAKRDRGT